MHVQGRAWRARRGQLPSLSSRLRALLAVTESADGRSRARWHSVFRQEGCRRLVTCCDVVSCCHVMCLVEPLTAIWVRASAMRDTVEPDHRRAIAVLILDASARSLIGHIAHPL